MMSGKCKGGGWHKLSWLLLIIGGLNWGLVGLQMLISSGGNWNVVNLLLGRWSVVEGIIYLLVGLAALMLLFGCKSMGGSCKGGSCSGDSGNGGNA